MIFNNPDNPSKKTYVTFLSIFSHLELFQCLVTAWDSIQVKICIQRLHYIGIYTFHFSWYKLLRYRTTGARVKINHHTLIFVLKAYINPWIHVEVLLATLLICIFRCMCNFSNQSHIMLYLSYDCIVFDRSHNRKFKHV